MTRDELLSAISDYESAKRQADSMNLMITTNSFGYVIKRKNENQEFRQFEDLDTLLKYLDGLDDGVHGKWL